MSLAFGEATSHPGCPLDQPVPEAERAGSFHQRWRRAPLQQVSTAGW
ncbi:hypothetical protein ADILRU_0986 [Leifsonia rubra CMS 76R]|nr:hypothetical protein ADILRU_0986 [Leifsonia rubra CMS 76R]